jgi:hypothetical protein
LIVLVCGLATVCFDSISRAEEEEVQYQTADEKNANNDQEVSSVYFETEGDFFLGYRWLTTNDSLKAAEYLYPHSSLSFGLNLLSCPLPYRYHLNTEFISKHDFYMDAGFAYKDLVLFRDILVGVHHNLEHFPYDPMYNLPGEIIYTDRNAADTYNKDFTSNLMSLRLKAPDFPFHTFIKHRYVGQDGKIQQRFVLGYHNQEQNMISESRDIDWQSNAVQVGANSHLGPVEIEYDFDKAEFDPGSNNILYDDYPASSTGSFSRPAERYPHNVIPETESSAHTLKMHSSYTGGIVAAATLSNLNQKNNYSLTESTTWKGALDFSWIPAPVIGMFFKYRHKDVDMDTPATVTLIGISDPNNPTILPPYTVRPGISYDKDILSLYSRYKPLKSLSLLAGYEFSQIDRKDTAGWELLPSQTKVHTIDLVAHAKPVDRVKVKAKYEYKNYDQPAYNTSPDNSNKLQLTTTYMPLHWLNIYLEYLLYLSERDPLQYLNGNPAVAQDIGERDGRHDQFLASLTTAVSPVLSMTFSWFYHRWDVTQDLAFGIPPEPSGNQLIIDPGVPYTDKANSFSFALQWLPREDITVDADVTYTITKGTIGGTYIPLSAFSNQEAEETAFSLDLSKKFSNAWEIGLRTYLNIYNDKTTGLLDGNVFTSTFLVKRYF